MNYTDDQLQRNLEEERRREEEKFKERQEAIRREEQRKRRDAVQRDITEALRRRETLERDIRALVSEERELEVIERRGAHQTRERATNDAEKERREVRRLRQSTADLEATLRSLKEDLRVSSRSVTESERAVEKALRDEEETRLTEKKVERLELRKADVVHALEELEREEHTLEAEESRALREGADASQERVRVERVALEDLEAKLRSLLREAENLRASIAEHRRALSDAQKESAQNGSGTKKLTRVRERLSEILRKRGGLQGTLRTVDAELSRERSESSGGKHSLREAEMRKDDAADRAARAATQVSDIERLLRESRLELEKHEEMSRQAEKSERDAAEREQLAKNATKRGRIQNTRKRELENEHAEVVARIASLERERDRLR